MTESIADNILDSLSYEGLTVPLSTTPARDFTLLELLDAQANKDHPLNQRHHYLQALGIDVRLNTKKKPRFEIPIEILAQWIYIDCLKSQDFSNIPNYLSLSYKPLTEKEKAIKSHLMCFYDFYASEKYYWNFHRLYENIITAAKHGHLKSRELIIIRCMFDESFLDSVGLDTIRTWIDSLLYQSPVDYKCSNDFYAAIYWSEIVKSLEEGKLHEIYKKSLKENYKDEYMLHLGDVNINLYGVPKAKLIHLSHTIADCLGRQYVAFLKTSNSLDKGKPCHIHVAPNLGKCFTVNPKNKCVNVSFGAPGLNTRPIKLSINDPEETLHFFDKIKKIIDYKPIEMIASSNSIIAFARDEN